MDDDDVIERVNRGTKEWLDRAQECMAVGKTTDAKKMVVNAQKEVRAIKAEVVAEEREVRAHFTDARLKAGQTGQTIGLFVNSKNRGRLARARAAGKRSIAQQKQDALEDYRLTKAALDKTILQLDRVKLDIDLGKFEVGTLDEPLSATLAPPTTPATWAADPTGRFELRYWDGGQWTEHVSTHGSQSIDPMR